MARGGGKKQSRSSKRKQNRSRRPSNNAAQQPNQQNDSSSGQEEEKQQGTEEEVVNRPVAKKVPASSLETLKVHLMFKVLNYLDDEERENLFRSQEPDEMWASDEDEEDEDEEEEGPKGGSQSTVEWNEQVAAHAHLHQQHVQQQGQANQQEGQDNQEEGKEQGQEQKKRRPAGWKRNLPPEFYTVDPDTLLARLNTRRLRKRLQEPIPMDDPEMPPYIYPTNMTTEDIARLEWKNVLFRAGREYTDLDDGTLPPFIPVSKAVLLFSPCPRAVGVLASYPRSGNSLMRTMYERITNRVTGSDMRGGLVEHDLVGEAAVTDKKVQFVKTHFPERRGHPAFEASRVVLLVRNPYDALESYFNLMTTGTHTTSLSDEMREKTNAVWEDMVRKEIQVWKEFHEYWLRQDIPILLVRYEDLIRWPYEVMCRVTKFVLTVNDMDFFCRRIKRIMDDAKIQQMGSYQPRSGGIGKSLKKYSPELLQEMNVGILETMEKFEYTDLLVPRKEDWSLKPLEGFAREYNRAAMEEEKTVWLNNSPLVRTPKHRTNWAKLKREMSGIKQQKCQCAKCTGKGR